MRLARRLKWDWVDTDNEIERRTGRPIREIFANDGEAEFRRIEREVISDLVQREQVVLSTGGGAILNPDTRRDLRAAGPVVWLTASVQTIASRILQDASTIARRPNLTARGGVAEIREVLAAREPAGLDIFEDCALLRSISVVPSIRGKGYGKLLNEQIESFAKDSGISCLYLITHTAKDFFGRQGYCVISRDEAPEPIRQTDQFSSLCPSTAVVMKKRL